MCEVKCALNTPPRVEMSGVAGVTLVKAIYSFKGSHNDELNFKKGAVITLTQKGLLKRYFRSIILQKFLARTLMYRNPSRMLENGFKGCIITEVA